MRRGRLAGLIGIVVVGAVALAAIPYLRGFGRTGDVPVFEVRRAAFERKVQAEGNLKAVEATPVTAPIDAPGALKIAWLMPDGSRVKAREVVVRFDPTDMEKSLADGQADRETADQRIAGRRAEGEGNLRNLQRDSEMADLDLRYAREFQSKDAEIFSRGEIIESQIDEGLATHRKENAEAVRDIRANLIKVDIDLLGIERHKAELKIAQAEKGLRALEVAAPHDGILVLKREWRGVPKVGDTVWRGQPLAEIPRLDAMEAEVYVLEADAGGLAVGRSAVVTLEAHPDVPFTAKIKKVETLAKPRVPWVPVQYFGVTLAIDRTDPVLMKPGQRIRVALMLDERKDAIAIPRGAVFEKDGKKVVYRRSGWSFDPVEVDLGPSALGSVVVEKGLNAGDVIALRDPTRPAGEPANGKAERENGTAAGPGAGGVR